MFIGPCSYDALQEIICFIFCIQPCRTLSGLSNLQCFGTDGEEALFGAFQQVFPNAVHLLCALHFRQNIKAKLHDLNIQEDKQEIVISDIFGKQVAMQQIVLIVKAQKNSKRVLKYL